MLTSLVLWLAIVLAPAWTPIPVPPPDPGKPTHPQPLPTAIPPPPCPYAICHIWYGPHKVG
jgi:hypothetical protein